MILILIFYMIFSHIFSKGEFWMEHYTTRTPKFGFLMDCLGVDFVLALSLLPHLLITDGVNG